MGADYSFYVKFIATRAPTFLGYIISVLDSVLRAYQETILKALHKVFYYYPFTLAKTEIIYPKNVGALVAMNFT